MFPRRLVVANARELMAIVAIAGEDNAISLPLKSVSIDGKV